MEKEEIIELLNQDLEGEHGAIIQYLTNAYAMGEGEMSCEIEAIAREEMRHLDWLAEAIVELGGTPSLKRGKMRMDGDSVADWMKNGVLLEEDAMAPYREHIKLIDDPKIKRLLQRILSDEESHHGDFAHFVEKAKKEGAKEECYVLSTCEELYAKTKSLSQALEECVGSGLPSIILCIPDKLAYFEAEQEIGPPPRFLLKKN